MTNSAWLYVRGPESVRVVLDGTDVAIYGPGTRVSHSRFDYAIDAALHQATVEQSLVLDGWTLEALTTERRAPLHSSQHTAPAIERRRTALRLVPRLEAR